MEILPNTLWLWSVDVVIWHIYSLATVASLSHILCVEILPSVIYTLAQSLPIISFSHKCVRIFIISFYSKIDHWTIWYLFPSAAQAISFDFIFVFFVSFFFFFRFDTNKSTKGASKLRRDLINAEIANLRDLLPLPQSTRQRLSQLQLMALVCVYVRKANYFQQGESYAVFRI